MASDGLNRLSACEIAHGIAAGKFTAEAVLRDCLARIAAREPLLKAWAAYDFDLALSQARICDRTTAKGPLHGVPLGVKDVIDTADLPTQMGSPIYDGHRPARDASCVARLRAAGAIILGKTVTCEFAGATPGATVHPHNATHTPGGSSSGSAAAVADAMVPAALGTQTRGSILRPASYCGVIGYKPSYALVSRDGLKLAAESFDTIGVLARSIDDADLMVAVLTGRDVMTRTLDSPPVIGLCREGMDHAQIETVQAIEDAARRLEAQGAKICPFDFPGNFEELTAATKTINDVERARAMAWEWNTKPDLISERLRKTIAHGLAVTPSSYADALRLVETSRNALPMAFGAIGVVLAPCANGEAPAGLDYTGDPFFQGVWTALHAPAISLPTHRGPTGLPVGIQLVGRRHADEALLAAARWIFSRLGSG